MSVKEHEMDAGYKRALTDLVEAIKTRDECAELIKFMSPERLAEGQKLLAGLNKKIEEGEAVLAAEHESYQKYRRAQSDFDVALEEMLDRVVKVYIHVKYNNPEMVEAVLEKALAVWVEREQEFHDRVAIYEANPIEFKKIIARAKDNA